MDPQEVKDRIKNALIGLIKDTEESKQAAVTDLHDVLAHKMREKINPPESQPESIDDVVELDEPPQE